LYYNIDKIFTEVRKIISLEKNKENSFLNYYKQECKKEKEESRLEK